MLKSLAIGAGLALALAACASGPAAAPHPQNTLSSLPLGCVPDTSTRRCDAFGTYYKGDDLRRTGAQHVGAALNMVDPELTH